MTIISEINDAYAYAAQMILTTIQQLFQKKYGIHIDAIRVVNITSIEDSVCLLIQSADYTHPPIISENLYCYMHHLLGEQARQYFEEHATITLSAKQLEYYFPTCVTTINIHYAKDI